MIINFFTGGSPLTLLGLILLSLGLQMTTVSAKLEDAYKAFDQQYLPRMKTQMVKAIRSVAEHERSSVETDSGMGATGAVFNKRSTSSQVEESIEAMKSASSELLGQFRVLGHGIIKEQFPLLTSSEVSKEQAAELLNKKLGASWEAFVNEELGGSVEKRNVLRKRGLGQFFNNLFGRLKGAGSATKAGTASKAGAEGLEEAAETAGKVVRNYGAMTGRFFARIGRDFAEFFGIKVIYVTMIIFGAIGLALFVVDMAKKGSASGEGSQSAIKPPAMMADDEIFSSSKNLELDEE